MIRCTRRRLLLAAGTMLAPVILYAQPKTKTARIGYLSLAAKPDALNKVFEQTLRELGWVKDSNLLIEYRWAANNMEHLPALANELDKLKLDLIVARSTPVVQAVKNIVKTTPIVMGNVADPVASGFVASLARPRGNITGTTIMGPELAGKRLEILRDVYPPLSRATFLAYGADPAHTLFIKQTEDAGRALRIQINPIILTNLEGIDEAFRAMSKDKSEALLIQPLFITILNLGPQIAALALHHRLPTASEGNRFADLGGLIYYGPERAALERRVAAYVDRILRGAKPAELPIEQPTTFELVVNLKTAKALNLAIPPSVLVRAERVIE